MKVVRRVRISLKMLMRDRKRFIAMVAMVGAFSVIVMTILGLRSLFVDNVPSYYEDTGANAWVLQEGQKTPFSSSILTQADVDELVVDGHTEPLGLFFYENFDFQGNSWSTVFHAVNPGGRLVPRMEQGSAPESNDELAVDKELSEFLGLDINDIVTLSDSDYRVSGITESNSSQAHVLVFVTHDGLMRIAGGTVVSAVAVFGNVEENSDRTWVRTQTEFLEDTQTFIVASVDPFVGVIVLVSVIGLALLVAIKLASDIRERSREYGLLKLVGATNLQVIAAEIVFAVICLATGVLLSLPFTIGLLTLLGWPAVANVIELVGPTAEVGMVDVLTVLILLGLCYGLAIVRPLLKLRRLTAMEFLKTH